jgi:hypothetical protein
MSMKYSRGERLWLVALAVTGFVGINGVFLWTLFAHPAVMREALANPLALAFMAESMLLVAVLAWLFRRWGLTQLGWGWFVALSLIGSLAFAIPVALLLPRRDRG